jgi:outer membrane murein-binding lipoprotein Lpp
MKNSIFNLALLLCLTSTLLFTGCQTPAQKVEDAKTNVDDANQDLNDVKKDAMAEEQRMADEKDWMDFKTASEMRIRENETRITELKSDMKKSGKKLDAAYEKKIVAEEEKNKALETRMTAYHTGQSDWAEFKREFNHDMDELGQALKDLTVNNKK